MTELATSRSDRGEVVLLRRERDAGVELRVNGVFVMDDVETSSEQMLARSTLSALETQPGRTLDIVVGGLGLGFTLRAVLADPRVRRVVVAEIEPALVEWHRDGTLDAALGEPSPVGDERVQVEADDVRTVVTALPTSSVDLILLDVDNGPGYLVYDANDAVYREDFLHTCLERLSPGGVTAVWSASEAPGLVAVMENVFGSVDEWKIPVILGPRATAYFLYLSSRPGEG